MELTEAFTGLECTACGGRFEATEPGRCPDCGSPLDPSYDYDAVDADALAAAAGGSMWRFEDVLPFARPAAVSVAEGGTPTVSAPALAEDLGVGSVLLKDEGRNPTGSVVDRGLALAVTAAAERGLEPLALAAAGNAGQSAATYAGRAGLRSYAFVPSRAPFTNKAMVNVHGGQMRVAGGRYPDAVAAQDDLETEWHSLQEFTSPYRHEGAKTLAYELVADRGWEAPDAVVVPDATGELVVGVVKGLRELATLGLIDETPPVYAAQAEGCAPLAAAWERDGETVEPWEHPDTIAGELEIPDPAGGDLALAALRETDGGVVAVDDPDLLEAAVDATERTGVEVGPAGGAGIAAVEAVVDDLPADASAATVAVVNPATGATTADVLRSHLMSKGV